MQLNSDAADCRVLKLHVWLICRSTCCAIWRWRWGETRWSM